MLYKGGRISEDTDLQVVEECERGAKVKSMQRVRLKVCSNSETEVGLCLMSQLITFQ